MADQWEQIRVVPKRMLEKNLTTRLYRVDTQTGDKEIWAEIPFWVTHTNFDPQNNDRLTFGKMGDSAKPHTWCLESDGRIRPLFKETKFMVCTHDSWSPDGEFIIFHGWNQGIPFFGARTWEGKLIYQIPIPKFSVTHIAPTLNRRAFIFDTTAGFVSLATPLRKRSDYVTAILTSISCFLNRRRIKKLLPQVPDFFIHRILDGETRRLLHIRHLYKHNMGSWRNQDAHVHPSITPKGGSIIFTSDREGTCNVYEVFINKPTFH